MADIIPFPNRNTRPRSSREQTIVIGNDRNTSVSIGATKEARTLEATNKEITQQQEKAHILSDHGFMVMIDGLPHDHHETLKLLTTAVDVVKRIADDVGGQEEFRSIHRGVSVFFSKPALVWQPTRRLTELHIPNNTTTEQLEAFIRSHLPKH